MKAPAKKTVPRKRKERFFPMVDITFHARMTPKYASGADAIELNGYKSAIYLQIVKSGCCPRGSDSLEMQLYDRDFDKLISMLKNAKKAVKKARDKARKDAKR